MPTTATYDASHSRLRAPARLHACAGLAAALLACACAVPSLARAQARPSTRSGGDPMAEEVPVYDLRLAIDLPLIVASGAIGSSWLLRGELAPPECAPHCDATTLPSFDRGIAGRHDTDARIASDVGVATVIAGSAALLAFDGGFTELVVGTEAVLATSAVAVLTMFAVRRPRPFLYGEEAPLSARRDGNAGLSFPSGHTANAFAATFAAFHTLRAHHPDAVGPWIALGAGVLMSSAVGVSRVLAGDHFPSDVAAGAVIGSAIGWLVPELHRIAPTVSLTPGAGGGLSISGSF